MNYHKDNGLLNMIRRTDPMINDPISPKRNIPLREGERDGVWEWIDVVTFVSAIQRILPMQ